MTREFGQSNARKCGSKMHHNFLHKLNNILLNRFVHIIIYHLSTARILRLHKCYWKCPIRIRSSEIYKSVSEKCILSIILYNLFRIAQFPHAPELCRAQLLYNKRKEVNPSPLHFLLKLARFKRLCKLLQDPQVKWEGLGSF